MNLRNQLLRLVATPDRAWLTMLAGLLLLCREFIAPGRVIPGVLGALGLFLGAFALSDYRIGGSGLALLLLSIAMLVVLIRYWSPWYFPALVCSSLGAAGARMLILPPWKISAGVALATMPAFLVLGFLLSAAVRARRNKFGLRRGPLPR